MIPNSPWTAILSAFTLCAVTLTAGQPVPPPADPKVKTPRIELDNPKVERSDKVDEKMFPDGLSHDFGKVHRGIKVYHVFRIVNTSNVPLRISSVRLSMPRGTSASSSKYVIQPKEEGKIEVVIDTRRFVGTVSETVYLLFDQPRFKEDRLWVRATSCDNLAFFPDDLDFGKIQRGDTPTRRMIVAVPDQPKLQITGATCASKFIQVNVEEIGRGKSRAVYQVSATVQGEVPEGELHTEVVLTTNNPAMPKLLVPVSVVLEAMR